jgi:hypothetical protein
MRGRNRNPRCARRSGIIVTESSETLNHDELIKRSFGPSRLAGRIDTDSNQQKRRDDRSGAITGSDVLRESTR